MTIVKTRVLEGFDDPTFGPEQWGKLLPAGDTDVVFLTWQWQRAWWETRARGELLLIAAEQNGQAVALAPLYAHAGMIYFVGLGTSDYLDFIGEIGEPEVLQAILETARARVPDFQGFEFHSVPDSSRTGKRLQEAADRLNLACYKELDGTVPALDLAGRPEIALAAVNRKSLVRHERFFRRGGLLDVRHLRDGEAILPHLDEFFEQHIARRAATPSPSNFLKPARRVFIKRLTRLAAHTGWLRFTRVDWEGRPIAFHFGFCYGGSYLWYKPSFSIDLARRSPGEVLLRQLLLAAIDEGASTFDFGGSREAYKLRFATHVTRTHEWGLYPK